jgi:hypothetical protein
MEHGSAPAKCGQEEEARSDEERDAIEREMEQCAAEEAARAEAEAEAEADRAMSAEGKVICVRAEHCRVRGETCIGMEPHIPEFVSENKTCTTAHYCSCNGEVKCVPVSGEEK